MFNNLASRAKSDFARTCFFKAFTNRIRSVPGGQPTTLPAYDEVKEKLRIGGPLYRGVQTVEADKIVGSLNRCYQFNRAFLPLEADFPLILEITGKAAWFSTLACSAAIERSSCGNPVTGSARIS